MATKKSVTFYAAADVADWINGLSPGEVSRQINDAIREGALKPKELFQIPLSFYQMSDLLEILRQEVKRREETLDAVDPDDLGGAQDWASKASLLFSHIEQFVR
jgi:hypothetical protein